ncbi:hypothetical protein NJ7G_0214 [Natrinema sp. J7-2]|nr:hypothetical protein NJ7G_0214 [Natrinema sp. J7-2]
MDRPAVTWVQVHVITETIDRPSALETHGLCSLRKTAGTTSAVFADSPPRTN